MELKDIIKEENIVYKKTPLLTDKVLSYCPGCGHGTAHRLIMEVFEEMVVLFWHMISWILICFRPHMEELQLLPRD